jgi:hypothetical protein
MNYVAIFFYNYYALFFILKDRYYYAIIVIIEDNNGKCFYDNKFITRKKSVDELDYSKEIPTTRQKTCAHLSTGNILQNILNA